jgi:uncharacterized protein (TIGR02588 family)
MAMTDAAKPAPQESTASGPPFWEWVVAAVGLALMLASLGYLVVHAVMDQAGSPVPMVTVTGIERQEGGAYLVSIRVQNQGRATAAGLKISGSLKRGAEVVEESETEVQYLAGGSSRAGGLFFTHDPRQFRLEVAAKGYELP